MNLKTQFLRVLTDLIVVSFWYDYTIENKNQFTISNNTELTLDFTGSRIVSYSTANGLRFLFDYDFESKSFLGGFKPRAYKPDYRTYYNKTYNNIFPLFIASTWKRAFNMFNTQQLMDYAEGIRTLRVRGDKIVEAVMFNEELFLEIKQEQEGNIYKKLNKIHFKQPPNQIRASKLDPNINLSKAKTSTGAAVQKDIFDKAMKSISRARNKYTVFQLIVLNIVFFIAAIATNILNSKQYRNELTMRREYGAALNNLFEISFELNSIAENIIELKRLKMGISPPFSTIDEKFEEIKESFLVNINSLHSSENKLTTFIGDSEDRILNHLFLESKSVKIIFFGGSTKNYTLLEGIKQITANLIEITTLDLKSTNFQECVCCLFLDVNSNMYLQLQIFKMKDIDFWLANMTSRISERLSSPMEYIQFSIIIIMTITALILTRIYIGQLERMFDIIYNFKIEDCEFMKFNSEKLMMSIIFEANNNDTDSNPEYDLHVTHKNEDLEDNNEIKLSRPRKRKETLSTVFIWLYIPTLIISFVYGSSLFIVSKSYSYLGDQTQKIDHLRSSTFVTMNLKKLLLTMTEISMINHTQLVWDEKNTAIEQAIKVYNGKSAESETFFKYYIENFEEEPNLTFFYHNIFTSNLCDSLRVILDKKILLYPTRKCEDVYNSTLTHVKYLLNVGIIHWSNNSY